MTVPVTMPNRQARAAVPWRRRLLVRLVVRVALVAAKLPPRRLYRLMSRASVGARPAGHVSTARVHKEVLVVRPRCAGWRACLPRSISIALLCRLRGEWPDWCVGVRAAPPFAAHAWVQAEGRLVGEPGTPADYRPLIAVARS